VHSPSQTGRNKTTIFVIWEASINLNQRLKIEKAENNKQAATQGNREAHVGHKGN
jgi:hypothetical protein